MLTVLVPDLVGLTGAGPDLPDRDGTSLLAARLSGWVLSLLCCGVMSLDKTLLWARQLLASPLPVIALEIGRYGPVVWQEVFVWNLFVLESKVEGHRHVFCPVPAFALAQAIRLRENLGLQKVFSGPFSEASA